MKFLRQNRKADFLPQNRKADFLCQMLLQIPSDARDDTLLLLLRLLCRGNPLFKQRDFQIIDASPKFLIVHRLQDIICDLQPQCLLAIGKIIIARHDHIGDLRVFDAAELDDL